MRGSLFILSMLICSGVLAQTEIRKSIQSRFILAQDGETIQLDEGVFSIDATLSMEGRKI